MGLFDTIFSRARPNSSIDSNSIDLLEEDYDRVYLKRLAIDTVLNYVARSMSASYFRVLNKDKVIEDAIHYKLNIRPNTDSSAADFWQQVFYKLMAENEVLVVTSDTNDLLIADDYVRNELALYEDTFSGVTVKSYTFQRTFKMNEVIYLTYNNESLSKYVNGLFSDYSKLFGRMYEIGLRNNQIRGTVSINAVDKTLKQNELQSYMDRMFTAFKDRMIAIVPTMKGVEYNELTGAARANNNQSIDELFKLKKGMIDEVAKIIGIPPALVNGEMATLDSNSDVYLKYTIQPIINKLADELNAKLFTQSEFLSGKHIEIIGIDKPSVLKVSDAIDKLAASGVFTGNEIRKELGYNPREGLDEVMITKNYTSLETAKGGD